MHVRRKLRMESFKVLHVVRILGPRGMIYKMNDAFKQLVTTVYYYKFTPSNVEQTGRSGIEWSYCTTEIKKSTTEIGKWRKAERFYVDKWTKLKRLGIKNA